MSIEEGYRIDSAEKADVALRKYSSLIQKKQRHDEMANKEITRIKTWQEEMNAKVDSSLDFIRGHLEVFAMKQRLAGEKSFDSPSGSIKSRQTPPSVDIDNATFVEWAQENNRDDCLNYTVRPDVKRVKQSFVPSDGSMVDPATGEVVPGLIPVAERISFILEPDLSMANLGEDDDGE